jgi:hypothetical protein
MGSPNYPEGWNEWFPAAQAEVRYAREQLNTIGEFIAEAKSVLEELGEEGEPPTEILFPRKDFYHLLKGVRSGIVRTLKEDDDGWLFADYSDEHRIEIKHDRHAENRGPFWSF